MKTLYRLEGKSLIVCDSEKEIRDFLNANIDVSEISKNIQKKLDEIRVLEEQLKTVRSECKHERFHCDEGYYFDVTYCARCGKRIEDII